MSFDRDVAVQVEQRSAPGSQDIQLHDEPLESARDDFRRRFLGLALEAYRRDDITRSKLGELASMVDMRPDDVRSVLSSVGLD